MKTAAKIFIIISMVVGCWLIFPLIVGGIALSRLNKATSKDELVGVAICTLLFCNTIAGILMLCMSDDDLRGNRKTVDVKPEPNTTSSTGNANTEEITKRLRQLEDMKNGGIITEEEYKKMREEILREI